MSDEDLTTEIETEDGKRWLSTDGKEYKSTRCLSNFYIPLVNNSRFSCSYSIFPRSNYIYAIYSKIGG